ncbi:MAG: 30S ribosome-binding factor RbfA [Verrucomicrobia bacterium]|nr:30S ribosome-binding factor RbfA [Verrucomicrobiota bacterium]MBU1910080.1 30S ribosome-binding factor RbfA [Verrucomicrobiota bacterium]
MSRQRMVRVNELLKREVASALYRVMNEAGFDLTAVTVTGVDVGSDLRTARVRVSIRDHRDERRKMLNLLRRHRGDIQELLHRNVILKYTPKLSFELDESIEQGDRILQILYKMENSGELERGGGSKDPTP